MMTRIAILALTMGITSDLRAADWPQWRGPERTGISAETGLLKAWPKDGPALRWKRTDLGTGYSSPAVSKGVVYIQTTKGNDEFTVAYERVPVEHRTRVTVKLRGGEQLVGESGGDKGDLSQP